MDVVFGEGPVAAALAERLGRAGSAVLATALPRPGPYLWRHADPGTGRGVKQALEGVRRVFVVTEGEVATEGLFLALRRQTGVPGAVVVPLGQAAPRGMADCPLLARVHHGPAWGLEEPLVAAWRARLLAGRRVWTADPGVLRPVALSAVVAAAVEAASRGPVRWTIAGAEPVRLPDLAAALAQTANVPLRTRSVPLRWALWSAGVPEERVRRWLSAPLTPTVADGWQPPGLADRAAWSTSGAIGGR